MLFDLRIFTSATCLPVISVEPSAALELLHRNGMPFPCAFV